MRQFSVMAVLLALSACSEQQLCISDATRDLKQVRSFVAEAQGNIDRGYAFGEKQEVVYELEQCGVNSEDEPVYCRVPEVVTKKVPVAIDLDGEAAKLKALLEKEAELEARAAREVEICKQKFPE